MASIGQLNTGTLRAMTRIVFGAILGVDIYVMCIQCWHRDIDMSVHLGNSTFSVSKTQHGAAI